MLGAVGRDMRSQEARELVGEMKEYLKDEKLIGSKGEMLEFGRYGTDIENRKKGSGERAFLWLRDEKHVIEERRGLRVYGRKPDGTIIAQDVIDSVPGKEPGLPIPCRYVAAF
jgi:hypothetical protein